MSLELNKIQYPILRPMPVAARYALVFDVETTGLLPKANTLNKQVPQPEQFPYIIQFSWVVYDLATNMIDNVQNHYIQLPPTIQLQSFITNLTGITQSMCDNGKPIAQILAAFYDQYMKCDYAIAHNLHFDSTIIQVELLRHRAEVETLLKRPIDLEMFKILIPSIDNSAKYNQYLYCTMVASKDICNIMCVFEPRPAIEVTASTETFMTPEIIIIPEPGSSPPTTSSSPLQKTPKPKSYKKFPKLSELHEHLFGYVPDNLHNSLVDVLVCLRCFLKIRCGYSMSNRKFEILLKKHNY